MYQYHSRRQAHSPDACKEVMGTTWKGTGGEDAEGKCTPIIQNAKSLQVLKAFEQHKLTLMSSQIVKVTNIVYS